MRTKRTLVCYHSDYPSLSASWGFQQLALLINLENSHCIVHSKFPSCHKTFLSCFYKSINKILTIFRLFITSHYRCWSLMCCKYFMTKLIQNYIRTIFWNHFLKNCVQKERVTYVLNRRENLMQVPWNVQWLNKEQSLDITKCKFYFYGKSKQQFYRNYLKALVVLWIQIQSVIPNIMNGKLQCISQN